MLASMSNSLLALLVRVEQPYMGAEVSHRVRQLLPDPVNQSPRLYGVLSRGGGVVFRKDVAEDLSRAGFTVTTFKPSPQERAYLTKIDPAFASSSLWLVTCDAGVAVKKGAAVACVPYAGLEVVSESAARESGALSDADYRSAERWVSRGSLAGWRVFGTRAQPPESVVQRALQTVKDWRFIASQVDRIDTARGVSRLASPSVSAKVARARAFLARTAQPVAVVSKVYAVPDGTAVGVAPVAAAPLVSPTLIVVGVIVLGVAAGVVYLAHQQAEAARIAKEMQEAGEEFRKPLLECVADRSRTPQERATCKEALRHLPSTEPPPTLLEQVTEIAPYAAGVFALGLGAFYLGPVIRQASETGAAGLQRLRERLDDSG
jgi:hypothetical protein